MSTASFFRDEAGVHLSLHLTPREYSEVMRALLYWGSRDAESVRLLLADAREREESKGQRDIMARFDDSVCDAAQ